jgi:hypothetical protein
MRARLASRCPVGFYLLARVRFGIFDKERQNGGEPGELNSDG